ncbi:hypothetical protein SBI67_15635 [Mycolicibacterium sp. 120266]|uniref:ribosome modulation factor n=1 Tax=Mycolicibacterium sp. 120266 TaxID=3090601 RepID=UPI00299F4451|nr:hypothetical protein [Mycolicibacterium sp. 120266]MDX1873554.1 hypothetical protein [Mycolicibacterium sp. 120266]
MTKRAEYRFALYAGSLAAPGDPTPYAGGESLVLAKLWIRGYTRMLRVRVETGSYTGVPEGRNHDLPALLMWPASLTAPAALLVRSRRRGTP